MTPETLCDTCRAPGACCKNLSLNGGRPLGGDGGAHRFGEPMSREVAERLALEHGVPYFIPVPLEGGRWSYSCARLRRDGRCGAYDDRPDVCRRYLPGQDPMCVHYWADPPKTELEDRAP